jgi:hypothetical protein
LIRGGAIADYRLSSALEKLHGALMFLSLLTLVKRAQIAALAGLRVFLARVEPILA